MTWNYKLEDDIEEAGLVGLFWCMVGFVIYGFIFWRG